MHKIILIGLHRINAEKEPYNEIYKIKEINYEIDGSKKLLTAIILYL